MEILFEKYYRKIDQISLNFNRFLYERIDWDNRLIGIKGARGAGKTTLILQYAKQHLPAGGKTLYTSLDDLYFTDNRLYDLADAFVKEGGQFLLLDEVHRYPNWSKELKNIYDDFNELTIIFTGSSIIHLEEAKADLSRRAVMYELPGLSFREFIHVTTGNAFGPVTMKDIIEDHVELARNVSSIIHPIEHFKKYLQYGYYPYFLENADSYSQKLAETISLALAVDLPAIHPVTYASIEKMRLLLHIISASVPFKPNMSKLSEHVGVTRASLGNFFRYLEDLRIIRTLYSSGQGLPVMQKPEKIFLHHPNHFFALSADKSESGSIRESFFINQVEMDEDVAYSEDGDFKAGDYIFEVGGKNKTRKQIRSVADAYVAADGIEIGHGKKIPLWLFGFFY